MCEQRKRRYLRQRGTWRADLDAMRRRGWSVRRCARELQSLYPGLVFTPRVVWYQLNRERLRQDALDGDSLVTAPERRRLTRESYQASRGFLLEGVQLPRRAVDVLVLLRQRGPLTRRDILAALGLRRLRSWGRHGEDRILPRLVRWRLVLARPLRRHRGRPVQVYRLAEWLLPRAV